MSMFDLSIPFSEALSQFCLQQLAGLLVASTLIGLLGMILAHCLKQSSAAARFWIWQMVVSAVIATFAILVCCDGIPWPGQLSPLAGSNLDAKFASPHPVNPQAESGSTPFPANRSKENFLQSRVGRLTKHQSPMAETDSLLPPADEITPILQPSSQAAAIKSQPASERKPTPPATPEANHHDAAVVSSPWTTTLVAGLISTLPWLAGLWLLGFIYLTLRLLGSIWICRSIVKQATPIDSASAKQALQSAIDRLTASHGITQTKSSEPRSAFWKGMGTQTLASVPRLKSVALRQTELVSVPFTFGIFRPIIVLPVAASNWSSEKLTMVLMHELTHVQRWDVAWNWVARFACCLAWFNPFIWFATRRSIIEREQACDDHVVLSGVSPTAYSESLFEIATSLSGRPLLASVSMADPPLKLRLIRILDRHANRRPLPAAASVVLTLLFFTMAGLAGLFRPVQAIEPGPSRLQQPLLTFNAPSELSNSIANTSIQPSRGTGQRRIQSQPQHTDPVNGAGEVSQATADPGAKASLKPGPLPIKQENAAQEETIQAGDHLSGRILSHDDLPVTGAQVTMRLYLQKPTDAQPAGSLTTITTLSAVTDAQGRYKFETKKLGDLPAETRVTIDRINAEGHVSDRGRWVYRLSEVVKSGSLKTIKLKQGRRVSGQIVDADGQPIRGIIRAAGSFPDPNHAWFLPGFETDDEGNFDFKIPVNYHVGIMALAPGHAPKNIIVPGYEPVVDSLSLPGPTPSPETPVDTTNITPTDFFKAGVIRMEKGTQVEGTLVDTAGNPIVGVVVGMETARSSKLSGIAFYAKLGAITDAEGKFSLPPAQGRTDIFVTNKIMVSNRVEDRWLQGKPAPRVSPVRLDLAENNVSHSVKLQELSRTETVSGTVHWDNGDPVAGLRVEYGAQPNQWFGHVLTDSEGKFQFELAAPMERVLVNTMGAKDEAGNWHIAQGYSNLDPKRIGQWVSFDLNQPVHVTYVLKALTSIPYPTVEETQNRRLFAKLQQECAAANEAYQKAIREAQTPEEKEEVSLRLDPRNLMIQRYLDFEARFRGKPIAFRAMNAALELTSGTAELAADTHARDKVYSRLIEHYLKHQQLGETFKILQFGPPIADRDRLLKLASKHSPHRHVRAQAFASLVEYALEDLRTAELLSLAKPYVMEQLAEAPERMRRELEQRIQLYENLNQDQLRAQALKWLDVIDTVYSDVRVNQAGLHQEKLKHISKRLRFCFQNLVTGKPVPNLSAVDLDGKPIKLEALRGKLVVLTLCFHTGGKIENQPLGKQQAFAKEYLGRDVAFISIVGVNDEVEFRQLLAETELVGSIAIEPLFPQNPNEETTRSLWYCNSAKSFLIDENGVLVHNGGDFDQTVIRRWLDQNLTPQQ